MSNSFSVKIVKTLRNLLEEPSAYRLFYYSVGALLLYILMKTYASNEISNDTYLLISFDQIIHLDNVWMVDFL